MSDSEGLSQAERQSLRRQFGISFETAVEIISCTDSKSPSHYQRNIPRGPDGSPPSHTAPHLESPTTTRETGGEINLESLNGSARENNVNLIACGAFYDGHTQAPQVNNANVVFRVNIGDLEACMDRFCLHTVSKSFVSTALTALENNVKAVLVKPSLPKWQKERADFAAFGLAAALKHLLADNFRLDYRDDQSKCLREKERLDKLQTRCTAGPTFSSVKEIPDSVYEADPFHPTTSRQIWVEVSTEDKSSSKQEPPSASQLHDQAWHWWSELQSYVGVNPKLALCLKVGSQFADDPKLAQRWLSERLRAISIPLDVWRRNKAGFPILPASLKDFIVRSFHIPHVVYLVEGGSRNKDQFCYLEHLYKDYLKHLKDPFRQQMMRHLADIPIRPLQPLRDHLTQEIYAIFEADPIKYKLYGEACFLALQDLKKVGRGLARSDPVIVMVVGAGRGPLVTEFITAAVAIGMFFKVYALDKNPIAISAMTGKLTADWKAHAADIHIVQSDMRFFRPKDKADILISELLGSFGCNELSPECLDGAQALLKPTGVSIPSSYSNFIQPVMAVSLHQDLATFAPRKRKIIDEFVLVDMRSVVEIAPYQEAFTFHHPNFEQHSNTRDAELTFHADNDYRLSGFAGYFSLNLWKGVSMNILPDKQTVGLTSWFPAFFGLVRPVDVKKGEKIVFHIGRRVSQENGRVWYCWGLLQPSGLPLQNAKPSHWISM